MPDRGIAVLWPRMGHSPPNARRIIWDLRRRIVASTSWTVRKGSRKRPGQQNGARSNVAKVSPFAESFPFPVLL
jgi:hypothetical protein